MKSFSFIKIRIKVFWLLIPALFYLVVTCTDDTQPSGDSNNKKITQDSLISYNKKVTKTEDEEIGDFINRYQWKMKKTATGLRYMIYHKGIGSFATKGKYATINYSVRLLNGDLAYSSEQTGPREFEIGHGGVESGLEEGILLLRVGDHAKFIVPSRLAFGLLGDQDKIPQRATLVYDIELINLK
jgi:FKBP-type peptidyl-prolyl cis-trans isomerase